MQLYWLKPINKGNLLIPIEWKYIESYMRDDKSIESSPYMLRETEAVGKKRLGRYCHLIEESKSLQHLGLEHYRTSIYFQEPFYQLMRQTLWAEQLILHQADEVIQADDYCHVHVVPNANEALLNQGFHRGSSMGDAWNNHLTALGKERYKIVDPMLIIKAIETTQKFSDLVTYLKTRYGYEQ